MGFNMSWIQILSAIGFGALITKILDIVWLQRALRETEKRKCLREKRLSAYTAVTKEILSLGKDKNTREDHFSGYALASEAILLADSKELANEIEVLFTNISNLYREATRPENDPERKAEDHLEGAYDLVVSSSRNLVEKLRQSVQEN
jgi:hypothetical protein